MRAGLLSDHRVIEFLNDKFVATWVLIDDLKKYAAEDHPLAETLAGHWEYPLDLMFLSSEGEFISKLNSFHDLPQSHPDVGFHGDPYLRFGKSTHSDVFLRHARSFLEQR